MNIEVVCINDKDRPADVPSNRWVKENEIYHITLIERMNIQGGAYGCKLAERNNDDLFPYTHFALGRFAPVADITSLVEELNRADGISATNT
jgi:hypothetical protein